LSFDLSEDIANEALDMTYDADATLSVGAKRFIERHVTQGARCGASQISRPARRREPAIGFADRCGRLTARIAA
jgi:hypothetical protein